VQYTLEEKERSRRRYFFKGQKATEDEKVRNEDEVKELETPSISLFIYVHSSKFLSFQDG
jgi:hypothetical protein